MHGLDLLLLVAVVAFLFFRLYNTLGQEDSETQERVKNLQALMQQESRAESQPAVEVFGTPDEFRRFMHTLPQDEQVVISSLWEAWPNFDPERFLKGVKKAFTLIVEAFAEGETKTLKPLLSGPLYKQFQTTIKERQEKDEIHTNSVESIRTIRLIEASVVGDKALVSVDVQSFQTYVVVNNKTGKTVHETGEDLEELWDRWTFTKKINDDSPAWTLVNIEPTPDEEQVEKTGG